MSLELELMMKDFLARFKMALIEENIEQINTLIAQLDEILNTNLTLDELRQLKALIEEASKLALNKKNDLAPSLQKLKLAQKFF